MKHFEGLTKQPNPSLRRILFKLGNRFLVGCQQSRLSRTIYAIIFVVLGHTRAADTFVNKVSVSIIYVHNVV